MIQFYLLSVVLNAASGLLLVFSKPVPEDAAETSAAGLSFFETRNFRLILGIATVLTGVMKLLSAVQGDIPVLGDLLPAVAGLSAGLCLLYEYYKASSSVSFALPAFFEKVFVTGRKYMGILCVFAATLHFIFPRVLFL